MNKKERLTIIYIVILLFFIIISSYLAVYFYDIRKNNLITNAINVKQKGLIDYNVSLEDNKFYDSSKETDKYILDLMNSIDGHFNYDLTLTNNSTGTYSYQIIGTLNGYDLLDNSNLLNKEVINEQSEVYTLNGNVLSLSANFVVPIKDLIESLNEYKTYYPNVFGEINYKIIINYDIFDNLTDISLKDEKVLTLNVPLNDSVTTIKTNNIKENNKYYSKNTLKDNNIYYVIFLEFIGTIIIFILVIILMMRNTFGKSDYKYTLDKIIKKYDDYLAELVDVPNLEKKNIITVESFEDLINIAEMKKEIIRFREIEKNKLAIFFIPVKNDVYLYKLGK